MTAALEKVTLEGFQALVFRVHDIPFAVDLEQIDELLEPGQVNEESEPPLPFDRLVTFQNAPVFYKDPRILTVQYQESRLLIQIDQPEDIVFIRLETMHTFPFLLEQVRETEFIWGVGLIHEAPVLLVDCHKIAAAFQKDERFHNIRGRFRETQAET